MSCALIDGREANCVCEELNGNFEAASNFSWMKRRAKVLLLSRRNVSNLGSGGSACVEMSSLCALGRPAAPKRPEHQRVW